MMKIHDEQLQKNTKAGYLGGEYGMSRVLLERSKKVNVVNVDSKIFGMLKQDLVSRLTKFVLEVCKRDGSKYLPKSILCCFKQF